jgi:hypothetical protein
MPRPLPLSSFQIRPPLTLLPPDAVPALCFLQQFIVGAVATMATVTAGMTLGFSAVTLPAMQTADRVSEEQASWIGECYAPLRT